MLLVESGRDLVGTETRKVDAVGYNSGANTGVMLGE